MSLTSVEAKELLDFIQKNKLSIEAQYPASWRNFSGNITQSGAFLVQIKSIAALQQFIRKVYELNQAENHRGKITVRVAAGGDPDKSNSLSYSFTSGASGDIILHLVGNEFNELVATADKTIMQVGASLQIGELEHKLYYQYDLALPTSSLIPYVTVAGLSANAGHGTGKDQPSFCGLIKAMTFCLPNGEIVRIDSNDPNFATIRASHLGLFGILLNVELECMPACKMQCITEARSVPEFLQELKDGLFANDPYVSVMYVPTYTGDELTNTDYKNVIIYRWRKVAKETSDVNAHPFWSHLSQEFEIKMQEGFHINDLLQRVPSIVPYYMRYLVCNSAVGKKDKISVGPWPLVHYQTVFPKQIADIDYLIPVNKNADEITAAVKKLITELSKLSKHNQYPITYAAYLRFFKGTKGGLSTSDGDKEYICGFDVVTTPGQPGFDQLQKELNNYFIDEMKAKPHWGKYLPAAVDFKTMYGNSYTEFMHVLQEWYKKYGMTLDSSMLVNEFAKEILGITHPKPVLYPSYNQALPMTKKYSTAYMASRTLNYIEGSDESAKQLRHALRQIAAKKYRNTTIFSDKITAAETKTFNRPKLRP